MDATANKTRVFIVDDDEVILKLLEAVLLKAGFDVQTTSNSETALQAIENTRPDVVISDLMMPEVDGFALCKGVCESPNLKIPVLSSSALRLIYLIRVAHLSLVRRVISANRSIQIHLPIVYTRSLMTRLI